MIPMLWSLVGCMYSQSLEEARSPDQNAFESIVLGEAAPAGSPIRGDVKEQMLGGDLADANIIHRDDNAAPAEADGKPRRADAPPPAEASRSDVRTWFPEAFLWQPRVITSDDGLATLDVRVPDQLTTWRILALAHDRSGQQAGDVHMFDSRLPIHVEPVVPGWLYVGDEILLPVRAVNSTIDAVGARLDVEAAGALRGLGGTGFTLAAGGSDVRFVPLRAVAAGDGTVQARLRAGDHEDAAQRSIPVTPTGRPVARSRGSTLASTRTFRLPPAPGVDPRTEELAVSVFPGALAVVQAEVDRLSAGARPDDGAYGFALASHLRTLAAASGAEVDDAVLRRLQLLAWQRIAPRTRALDASDAAQLLSALHGIDGNPLVDEVRPRLVSALLRGQRADGTWSSLERSTLQRVLVETAVAARALPEDQIGARLRAMGAVERHARDVPDGYTASVLLAAGLARGEQADYLRGLVEQNVVSPPGEAATVGVPVGAVNALGVTPRQAEILAWAVLALPPEHPARGDLVSELMGLWSAQTGFGAGLADGVALDAITSALPATPEPVDVVLALDGVEVARGRLDPAQPLVPLILDARPGARNAELTLTATPAMPGLAFVATRRGWVPWTDDAAIPGVDVEVQSRGLARGQGGTLSITASAPSGTRLRIDVPLPAGVQADPGAAGRATQAGLDVAVLADRVRLTTAPFTAGQVVELDLGVIPTFAGRFHTAPVEVSVDGGAPVDLRPPVWRVGR